MANKDKGPCEAITLHQNQCGRQGWPFGEFVTFCWQHRALWIKRHREIKQAMERRRE